MKIIEELDDNTWAQVHHHISEIGKSIEAGASLKPSAKEFFEVLSFAFANTNADLFRDIGPGGIESVTARLHKVPKKIDPGTVVGVPVGHAGWHPLIYIVSNVFGDAFGVFKDPLMAPILPNDWSPRPVEAIYSGLHDVRTRRWKILGCRPDLLKLFPAVPEIYQEKNIHGNRDNPAIGVFGAAQSPDGRFRTISREEAERVGLLKGTYRQGMLEEGLLLYLRDIYSGNKGAEKKPPSE